MGRLLFLAGGYSCSWMVTNDPGVTLPPHRGRVSGTQAAVVGTPAPGYCWPSYTGTATADDCHPRLYVSTTADPPRERRGSAVARLQQKMEFYPLVSNVLSHAFI